MLDVNSTSSPTTAVGVAEHEGVVVLTVTGELDAVGAAPVRSAVRTHLDARPRGLVIDLSGVGFLGSAGLQVLVEALVRAGLRGTALAVVADHRAVLRPLAVTDLDRQVTVHRTTGEAVAAMRAGTRSPGTAPAPRQP